MYAGAPQTLPLGDALVDTGAMGDCVSVIVCWTLVGTTYQNMRGWHGMGGIEAINFVTLFAGVPNVATTQVIVVASTMGSVAYLLGNVQQRVFAVLPNANIRVCKGYARATVNRHGIVTRV
jgi:hypothetical protein